MSVSNITVEAYNANYEAQNQLWATFKTDLTQLSKDLNKHAWEDQLMLTLIDVREIIRELKEIVNNGQKELFTPAAWMYHLDQHVLLAEEDGAGDALDPIIDFVEEYCVKFAEYHNVDRNSLWSIKAVEYTIEPLKR